MNDFRSGAWSGFVSNWPLQSEQPVLLLVHCAGFTARIWQPLLEQANLPVQWLAVDLPGHGDNELPHARTVVEIAEQLDELIQHLGLQQVVMAGHSLGGAVTLQCLHRAPAWLKAAILIGTGARLKVSNAILASVQVSYAAYRAGFLVVAAGSKADKDQMKVWVKDSAVPDGKTALADFNLCNGFDLLGQLGEIRTPVRVVHGEEDRVTPPKYGDYLAEHLPSGRLVRLTGVGHMVPLECPGLLATTISEFLREQLAL